MLRRREEKRSAGCDAQGSVLTAEEKRRESCDGGADMRKDLCSMLRRREENGRDAGRDEMSEGKRNENNGSTKKTRVTDPILPIPADSSDSDSAVKNPIPIPIPISGTMITTAIFKTYQNV